MAKPMSNTSFRQVDVDRIQRIDKENDQDNNSTVKVADTKLIERYILQKNYKDALIEVLSNSVTSKTDQTVWKASMENFLRIIGCVSEKEITQLLDAIYEKDRKLVDNLLKYVYKGFEFSTDGITPSHLLSWHQKIYKKCGVGSIIRVLTDRHRL
ncbi:hypothetical protein SNEBB_009877 [Seison nebaliae]|nr:hypothetical protein SNEBB_009877 [Seison nebaliae]